MSSTTLRSFVAIDFETATLRRDSACAVGLAAACDGRIVLARTFLIRPPSAQFTFTGLHDIGWEDVRDAPTFAELWPTLRAWVDDAAFVAAHNASFDRSVLQACCARYRLRPPRTPFICTVELARRHWGIYPTTLPDVCRRLRIRFRHHDAGQDAVACARIVLTAEAAGWTHHRLVARWASVPRQAATVSLDRTGSVHRPVTEVSPRVRTLWSRLWHLVTGARGWRDGFRGIRDVGGQRSSARPGRRSV